MDDLISRQAAIAAIDKNRDALLLSGMTGAEHILVHYGRRSIEDLPTIDPVKHGEWVGTEFDGYADGYPVFYEWACSICGCVFEDDEPTYNYCPNCGARMDGE